MEVKDSAGSLMWSIIKIFTAYIINCAHVKYINFSVAIVTAITSKLQEQ